MWYDAGEKYWFWFVESMGTSGEDDQGCYLMVRGGSRSVGVIACSFGFEGFWLVRIEPRFGVLAFHVSFIIRPKRYLDLFVFYSYDTHMKHSLKMKHVMIIILSIF